MVRIKHITAVLIVGAAAVFAYVQYFQGDEAQIREQFRVLAEEGRKDRKDTRFDIMRRVNNIKSFFSDSFEMNTPSRLESRRYEKKDLNTLALAVFSGYVELAVQFHDLVVSINENETADVVVTAKMSGLTSDGERVVEFHELECALEKVEDGEWLLTGVEFVDVLQK